LYYLVNMQNQNQQKPISGDLVCPFALVSLRSSQETGQKVKPHKLFKEARVWRYTRRGANQSSSLPFNRAATCAICRAAAMNQARGNYTAHAGARYLLCCVKYHTVSKNWYFFWAALKTEKQPAARGENCDESRLRVCVLLNWSKLEWVLSHMQTESERARQCVYILCGRHVTLDSRARKSISAPARAWLVLRLALSVLSVQYPSREATGSHHSRSPAAHRHTTCNLGAASWMWPRAQQVRPVVVVSVPPRTFFGSPSPQCAFNV